MDESVLQRVEDGYKPLIDKKAREWLGKGLVSSLHEDKPFEERLAVLAAELPPENLGDVGAGLDVYEAKLEAVFRLFFAPGLLAAVSSILGTSEVCISPIQHVRPHCGAGDHDALHLWHHDQVQPWLPGCITVGCHNA